MDGDKPLGSARGRSALLQAVFNRAMEAKPGAAPQADEPPRPRGRAALLALATRHALQMAGKIEESSSSSPPSSSSRSASSPSDLAKKLSEVEISGLCEYSGTSGSMVPATANYIALKVDSDKGIFEYLVEFSPAVDSKKARSKILYEHSDVLGPTKTFDGSVLYLPQRVIETRQEFDSKHPFDGSDVCMRLTFQKKKTMRDCIHFYNVLFKRIMHLLSYARIGRQYFSPENPYRVPQHRLEIWPGYVTAVDEYQGGIMLCLDTQHRVLRTQTVLDLMRDLQQMGRPAEFKQNVFDLVVGQSVLTRYNNKNYVVDDIAWNLTPEDSFETTSGTQLRYVDYYRSQYQLEIRDLKQPLLINRRSVTLPNSTEKEDRIICLVPELSYLTGLTDKERSDFNVMKDVAQYTRVTPTQRMQALHKFCTSVENNEAARTILQNWGLSIAKATIDLQARVLGPESIYLGGNYVTKTNQKVDWTRDACNNMVMSPVSIDYWVVIHTKADTRFAQDFVQMYKRLGPKIGIDVNEPQYCALQNDRSDFYVNALRKSVNKEVQLVVTITPTNRDDRYSAIKKFCCTTAPVASQVILTRTLKRPDRLQAVTSKIALQINCKLGGSLWAVHIPAKLWMVCGIDVYHSKGSNSTVCGFVSSLSENMTQWYSKTYMHKHNSEIGDHLKTFFIEGLRKFYEVNGQFPAKVVVFRDGVGDGQLTLCRKYEVAQFEDGARSLSLDKLDIIFVVVQKRINTRIYAGGSRDERFDNPPPGTVVDNSITRRSFFDFFLVSQYSSQGTASPTHYVVLRQGNDVKPDHIQRLAHKLCHMYYNWTGGIRVPAPCQYAHKLAHLVGQYVRLTPSDHLADRLYYL